MVLPWGTAGRMDASKAHPCHKCCPTLNTTGVTDAVTEVATATGQDYSGPHLLKADICLQGLAVDQLQRAVELTG